MQKSLLKPKEKEKKKYFTNYFYELTDDYRCSNSSIDVYNSQVDV